ncbi:FAD-dependent monooxygenase [uncultured Nitratireductor sp.]|uniref:FAD-dependent monooxygenase n=1 Tax=uncultured Nitratireductor sp. TaxID=520953 RepID=UPI0025EE5296|nr:FAD-dependent monooxygenase [uncultured Nitratireductor sp.]
MKTLIAGGSIGGIVAALYLHRVGIDVGILERAEEIRELCVGINMLPHAVEALAELGLLAEPDAIGIRTHDLIQPNRNGGPESVIDMIEARAPDGFTDIGAVAS